MMKDVTGRVIGQTPLKAGYWALDVEAPGVAEAAQPGQFVHVRVPGLRGFGHARRLHIQRPDRKSVV